MALTFLSNDYTGIEDQSHADGFQGLRLRMCLILARKRNQNRVIDFTSNEFIDFRGNPENFTDGVHLKKQAAREVVGVINHQLQSWGRN